jgi:hypothetical protein
MQHDGDAVGCDVDPLDQQPQDARLLSSPQPLRAGREALKLGRFE